MRRESERGLGAEHAGGHVPSVMTAELWSRHHAHDLRQELFGGRGVVRVWALVAAPAPPFTAVLACELEAGASVGPHVQEHFPELIIAVSGRGHVTVDGAASRFAAGSVVELSLGRALSISNEASDEPLRYLIVKAQALTASPPA